MKTPPATPEFARFTTAMRNILKVSPSEMRTRIDAHSLGVPLSYSRLFSPFLVILFVWLPLAVAQPGPDQAFTLACQQKGSDSRWSCSKLNVPHDVSGAAQAQALNMCRRMGDSVTGGCLATWVNKTGAVSPHFMLMGILYAPPGNASTSSIGDTTQTGTILGTSKNFASSDTVSVSVSVGFFGNGGTVGGSISSSSGSGHSDQTTVTTATTDSETLRSTLNPADSDNAGFHDQDEFLLWVNPLVTIKEGPTQGIFTNTIGTAAGEAINLVWVTAGELRTRNIRADRLADQHQGPAGQPSLLLTGLHVLTEADMDTILAQDRLINAPLDRPLDPAHFRLLGSKPLKGPDQLSQQFQISNTDATVGTDTQTEGNSDTFSVGVKITTPFADTSLSFTHGWNWTTTTTQGISGGTTKSSTVLLASNTVGCCGAAEYPGETCEVSIYQDLTYHSFAFVPESSCKGFSAMRPVIEHALSQARITPSRKAPVSTTRASTVSISLAMQGSVSRQGAALDNEMVTVYSDRKLVYKTFTDGNGRFFISNLPSGPLMVKIRDKSFPATVKAGKTAVVEASL